MVDELFQQSQAGRLWNDANAKAHTDFVQVMQGEYDPEQAALGQRRPEPAVPRSSRNSRRRECPGREPDSRTSRWCSTSRATPTCRGRPATTTCSTRWGPGCRDRSCCCCCSILIAPSRLSGLARAGAGWRYRWCVLVVGLAIGREWLVSQSPLQPQVTEAFARQLPGGLRARLRALIVVAAVVAAVALAVRPVAQRVGPAAGGPADVPVWCGTPAGIWPSAWAALSVAVTLIHLAADDGEPPCCWAMLLVMLAGLACDDRGPSPVSTTRPTTRPTNRPTTRPNRPRTARLTSDAVDLAGQHPSDPAGESPTVHPAHPSRPSPSTPPS